MRCIMAVMHGVRIGRVARLLSRCLPAPRQPAYQRCHGCTWRPVHHLRDRASLRRGGGALPSACRSGRAGGRRADRPGGCLSGNARAQPAWPVGARGTADRAGGAGGHFLPAAGSGHRHAAAQPDAEWPGGSRHRSGRRSGAPGGRYLAGLGLPARYTGAAGAGSIGRCRPGDHGDPHDGPRAVGAWAARHPAGPGHGGSGDLR